MYRVEQRDDRSWAIVDRSDSTLFVGTMRQCEDWLDHRQNLDRLASRTSWWRRLCRWLTRCCSSRRRRDTVNDLPRSASRTETTAPHPDKSKSEVGSSPAA